MLLKLFEWRKVAISYPDLKYGYGILKNRELD